MYPLKDWKNLKRGYLFRQPTFYKTEHLGTDIICPEGTPIYAWKDLGILTTLNGSQGGYQAHIRVSGGKELVRIMHLRELPKRGSYSAGEIIAYTGNTGKYSKAPHLHIDVSKNGKLELNNINNFIDPEVYFSNLNNMLELTIDKNNVQYLADTSTHIAIEIADLEQLAEIKAHYNFGEPLKLDPTNWLIFKGGSSNWLKAKFHI